MNHPNTIKHPDAFDKSQWHIVCPYCMETIGFDGIFHWGWTQGCWGKGNIAPTDFDGVVERHGHFLVFETKDIGKDIPAGQQRAFDNLLKAKSFCVMKIWGKQEPTHFEFQWADRKGLSRKGEGNGVQEARDILKQWYEWANR